MLAKLELLEQAYRKKFELVGADREAIAHGAEVLQNRIDMWEGARAFRDVRAVMIDESAKHPIDLRLWRMAALSAQCPFEHPPRPAAASLRSPE